MDSRTGAVCKAICLSLKPGLDAHKVRDEWDLALTFLTVSKQLQISVDREHSKEIRLDWNAVPSEIAHYTSYLQTREEYGGNVAYLDVYEKERATASQQTLEHTYNLRKVLQADAESDAKVALLQPRVCSLEGLFQAAELGNVHALKAMLRGYPLPTYDTATGTYHINSDRTALPQPKQVLRQTHQLSHTTSKMQYSTAGCHVAGDAEEDLRLSVSHPCVHIYLCTRSKSVCVREKCQRRACRWGVRAFD